MSSLFSYDLNNVIADRKIIVVVCSGGFTSSMMAQRMQKYMDELGKPYYVMYASIQALIEPDFLELYAKNISLVFISPQVNHYYEEAREQMTGYEVPVLKIESRVFGTMDYENLVNTALQTLSS
ncbi:hypothetical protein L4C38_15755 [Vibrio kasasachensis]|uniref:hypothetical protein n=1 Tax=Vibrio kasasachensis TaxID=2910248 RepID=UPI003D108F17